MARIDNKHLKVFAGEASNNGVFGSAADNTKVLSNDVEVIQSKPAWDSGWIDATISALKFPTLEEFQSVSYVLSSAIAYLRQEGIGEWNANTTYYQNSIVKKTGTYEIYGSLTDDNTGNLLSDSVNWRFLQDLSMSTVPDATTSLKGIAMLATVADVISGNADKIVTPDLLGKYGFQTGDIKATTNPTLQDGWVWAAGTIGNASSGATRANADTEQLFKMYWNATEYSYTGSTATGAALQVWNGSTRVAKGANADADWNAGRRISVPDLRDRVLAGRGNMVGNAGRLSGQPLGVNGNGLGNAGGRETHSLVEAENAEHTHGVREGRTAAGPGSGLTSGDDYTSVAAFIQTSLPSGGGSPHNNVQPTIICNYIIKL